MAATILITGGTGLVGSALCSALLDRGYHVNILSRLKKKSNEPHVKFFEWDIYQGKIDEACIHNVTAIVHLAGENLGAKPWTRNQKEKIVTSRTKSIKLIYGLLRKKGDHQVKTIISASAVGYYGNRGDQRLIETNKPGDDFLAQTCIAWEAAADEAPGDLRVVKWRTGIILAAGKGALSRFEKPIKAGLTSALGSGKQWVPWIHLKDIVKLYIWAIQNETIKGSYNAASPNPVTNLELTRSLATKLHRKYMMPNVPALFLRIILGEMSAMALMSTNTSVKKLLDTGFTFEFPTLDSALDDIYR